jgi:hypothetical protein
MRIGVNSPVAALAYTLVLPKPVRARTVESFKSASGISAAWSGCGLRLRLVVSMVAMFRYLAAWAAVEYGFAVFAD